MRIQEMRSGFSHLKKKVEVMGPEDTFEMHSILEEEATGAKEVVDQRPLAEGSVAKAELHVLNQGAERVAALSELDEPSWSVVSFERAQAASLSYAQAMERMDDLQLQGVNGLCIVTDEVAVRVKP